ncbi:MAG TPA: HlyD family secretion protein [Bryobacteraceae bacterium]|jgi:membrane fusion protein (multidrug efflux system)
MTVQEEPVLAPERPPVTRGRGRAFLVFFIVLGVIAIGGLLFWLHARQFETTDDAQVDAHLNAISARVDGTIVRVYVEDNQMIKPGDPLVDLDPRDYQVALNQALAQLAQARSMVFAQRPNVPLTTFENAGSISGGEADVAGAQAALAAARRDRESLAAKLAQAQANDAKAQADLNRYKQLIAKEEVSQQEYDQIAATAKAQQALMASSQADLEAANHVIDQRRAQLAQAETKLAQSRRSAPEQLALQRGQLASQEASAKTAEVQVEKARLDLSYTHITAPIGGVVMKRAAEVGAHVAAGQPLLTIAQIDDVWVTANFKETQLRNIRPGQSATLHVDSLNEDFAGYVENIGGSTGAVSSVLPPENATGNYVKIVQRIPVRIRFKKDQKGLDRLRPGMSVEPEVRIGG